MKQSAIVNGVAVSLESFPKVEITFQSGFVVSLGQCDEITEYIGSLIESVYEQKERMCLIIRFQGQVLSEARQIYRITHKLAKSLARPHWMRMAKHCMYGTIIGIGQSSSFPKMIESVANMHEQARPVYVRALHDVDAAADLMIAGVTSF